MYQSTNYAESNNNTSSTLSFNKSIYTLYGPSALKLAKLTSVQIKRMTIFSCHISFLKCCRDHQFIPKGLRLTNPLTSTRSGAILSKASALLVTERLNYFRQQFASSKILYDQASRKLLIKLDGLFLQKLTDLNALKATLTHRQQLTKHSKKFDKLLDTYFAKFTNPYKALTD